MTSHGSLQPDILIVGGGVAGSGLATVLARAGLGVTVVERVPAFRDRIRGESVHAWGVREMSATGLLDVALRHAGGRILPFWTKYHDRQPGMPYRWQDDFPDIPGSLSVRHTALQDALIAEAARLGATILRPATVQLAWPDGRPEATVSTTEGTHTYRPRLVVGADGDHSYTRSALGGTGITDPAHHAIGGALIAGIRLPDDSAHQAYHDHGFAMVFPQPDDSSRVYFVCTSEEAAKLRVAPEPAGVFARLRDVLPDNVIDGAESIGPVGFFTNSETMATVTHGPATVLVGDAASSNDPSQGHGLSLVFRDIRDLSERLFASPDWTSIPEAFSEARARDHHVLREHAHWVAPLVAGNGPEIATLQERVAKAREVDPSAGGFTGIFATGPAGLVADDAARRHFLGEDLQSV